MIARITMTGGAVREAALDNITYSDKYNTLHAWFWCEEKKEFLNLHLRQIHIENIEYIK